MKKQKSWSRAKGSHIYIHSTIRNLWPQGTLGLEIYQDFPEADIVVVPIGGGGLIAGVSQALKGLNPKIKIIGVESSGLWE